MVKARNSNGRFARSHGMSLARIYSTWSNMLDRCCNPNAEQYHLYGGRGITVCEQWQDFEIFAEDMGPKPKSMSLDRIDNDGPYSPENCRWGTAKQQARDRRTNRPVRFNGKKKTLPEWSEIIGLPLTTLKNRLRRGWSIQNAFTVQRRAYPETIL